MKLNYAFFWLFSVLFLAGCASKPSPQLYFLDDSSAGVIEQKFRQRVGLAEVILPAYARKDKIASVVDQHRIIQDDNHRWAEPPEEAISVAFTRALEHRLSRSVLLSALPKIAKALAPGQNCF